MIVSPNEEEHPKMLRKKAGLTIRAVSIALDVADSTITRWESGSTTPTLTLKQVSKLMKLYDCSVDQLDRSFTKARRERELKNKPAEEKELALSTSG
jgi:transcriptional regulator with XRE-family HTH domain